MTIKVEFKFPYLELELPTTKKFPSGKISRPYALVSFALPGGDVQPMSLLVDSGADVTLLPLSAGTMLGKDVKKGERFPISGVGKGSLETYLHEVDAKLGDHAFKMTVAFAETDKIDGRAVPPLLGRTDVFDAFDVVFEQRSLQTKFLKQ